MSGYILTFARPADRSRTLAKIVRVDWSAEWPLIQAVEPSPNFTRHAFRTRPFTDLADILKALRGAAISGEILVRGEPKEATGRRAIYDDPDKGPAGLAVVPRCHVVLDWDKLKGGATLPDGEPADPLLHPAILAEETTSYLPREFRDKSFIAQVSASAGIKGVRLRTFHILDRPRLGKDLKLWLRPAIERGLLDPVTLVECQPIYLGVTMVGGHDPCPERFVMIQKPGGEVVTTDGLDRTLEQIARDEAEEQERRATRAAARPAADDEDVLELTIRKAEAEIAKAGAGARHPAYTEQMARMRAIIDRHGGDWAAAADRLQDAYLSTLSAAEAAQRRRGSIEGVRKWVEARP